MRAGAGSLLFGIFAVMFGLLGAYVVRKEMHRAPQPEVAAEEAAKIGTVVVPIAGMDLEPGHKVELGDVVILKLPPSQLKAHKVTGPFMSNPKQIIGRVLKHELKEGSTFDTVDFYPEGTGPSVAERLKKGYRAVTVSVDQDSAVAGFAIPGSIVDVIFRADSVSDKDTGDKFIGPADDELPETTVTLIEAAEVLALNQETAQVLRTADPNKPVAAATQASVTLAVTPRQAAALRVVQGRGTMSLALRNKDDLDISIDDSPRTLNELLDRQTNRHKIEVYRGRQLTQSSFKNNERISPPPPVFADPIPAKPPIPQTAQTQPPPNIIIVNPANKTAFGSANN